MLGGGATAFCCECDGWESWDMLGSNERMQKLLQKQGQVGLCFSQLYMIAQGQGAGQRQRQRQRQLGQLAVG